MANIEGLKVGNKVKHLYQDHKAGEVVKIIDPSVNPYCVLVRIDGEENGDNTVRCFKPEHLGRC